MEDHRGSQSHLQKAGGQRPVSANTVSPHALNRGGARPQRSSHSESHVSEGNFFCEGFGPIPGNSGEIVWYNSNLDEPAEGLSQSSSVFGSSPRGDAVHRSLVFRAKRKRAQPHQDEGVATHAHSSITPNPHRSSSEPQRGRRKWGHSESERSRPKKTDNSPIMSGVQCLAQEKIWFDKSRYDEAERCFYEGVNGVSSAPQVKAALQPAKGHARPQKPRERKTSQCASKSEDHGELISRIKTLELDNKNLHKVVDDLRAMLSKLDSRMSTMEKSQGLKSVPQAAHPKVVVKEEDDKDDDDLDLFGSDEEDEEAERIKAQRVQEYAAKKAKKPVLIAKSSIILDVKPWDDETDMAKLEECVRSVQMDGLLWGASKLVPVGYGIKKLQINCVVEDDKVGVDLLEEEITKFEDYVQSVDVAAFNKI